MTRGLLQIDHVTFALRLAQIRLKGTTDDLSDQAIEFLLKGGEGFIARSNELSLPKEIGDLLDSSQQRYLTELQLLDTFSTIVKHVKENREDWKTFLKVVVDAENYAPQCWEHRKDSSESISSAFYRLLLLKAFRPDRLLAGAMKFVEAIFGDAFTRAPELDLVEITERESHCNEPLILCSMPGYDASSKVDDLAARLKKPYKALAMGSDEGFDLADKTILSAAKSGSWVLLKNIHLAPQWLVQLEKKLHNLSPNAQFRLFMTSEIHPKLPANLLRMAQVLVFEPPPGIKANLQHSFLSIPASRMDRSPIERSRMYFIMAWFHAVVQERLRYAPLGWTKTFEFNESDQRVALDTLDYWIDAQAQGRSNLAPEKIPWVALRTLLGQTVYGGKVDNEFDQRVLNSFLEQLFTERSFDAEFPLVRSTDPGKETLVLPEGINKAHFLKWVDNLPADTESPLWLGLPENAELLLLTKKGQGMLQKLFKLQATMIDEDIGPDEEEESDQKKDISTTETNHSEDHRPSWMRSLRVSIENWKKILPETVASLVRSAESVKNPLFRFFEREIEIGSKLLSAVHTDLDDLIRICEGNLKQTNHTRRLISDLTKGVIPSAWKKYPMPSSVSVNIWILDFAERIKQLQQVKNSTDFRRGNIWLGGLFTPEAYVTATRQAAAQAHQWSVENLELEIEILESGRAIKTDSTSFVVKGLTLEAAGWNPKSKSLTLQNEISSQLPMTRFQWLFRPPKEEDSPTEDSTHREGKITLPVYLNETRAEYLFSVDLPVQKDSVPTTTWFQRAVAINVWKANI